MCALVTGVQTCALPICAGFHKGVGMGLRSIRCGVALLIVFAGVPALAAEQQYSVTHFDTVRMQVPFRVIISTGKGNSGRGEGERDALDRVSLDVSGGVQIGMAPCSERGGRDGEVS